MHKFHSRCLSSVLDTFFTQFNERHNYSARISASNQFDTLAKIRKNYYWMFNVRFKGTKVWNSLWKFENPLYIMLQGISKSDLVKDYETLVLLLAVDLFPKVQCTTNNL